MKRYVNASRQFNRQDEYYKVDKWIASGNWGYNNSVGKAVQRAARRFGKDPVYQVILDYTDDRRYGVFELDEVITGLAQGIDPELVYLYAYPIKKYNYEQMCEIRLAMKNGQDYSLLLDPALTPSQMRYSRKTGKAVQPKSPDEWPSKRFWSRLDWPHGEDFEDAWSTYLESVEDTVNNKLGIQTEPSIQGEYGDMFIFDNSGNNEAITVSYGDWCEMEVSEAGASKSAAEFGQRYEKFVKYLITENNWK